MARRKVKWSLENQFITQQGTTTRPDKHGRVYFWYFVKMTCLVYATVHANTGKEHTAMYV